MPIPDDLVQQLEDVIRSCHSQKIPQGILREEVKALIGRIYSVRAGTPSKHNRKTVFDGITTWRRDVHTETGKWPNQPEMAKFVTKKFGYREAQAKVLARAYHLWNLKGYILLTPKERDFLKDNTPREWTNLKDNSKLISKEFAAMREVARRLAEGRKASAGHAKHIGRRGKAPSKSKGHPGKLIETAEEIFRLLDQS